MPPENEVRRKHEKLLLDKLYDMGVLSSASKLSGVEHGATVSAFARRRLPVVMTRLRMAENIVSIILDLLGTSTLILTSLIASCNQDD